jgi:putative transferase (TIGR04331 family)
MFLATTADQRFWNKDEQILFLGQWCKTYDQENIWAALDYELLPYHWDDRNKFNRDYKYMNHLYERLLIEMTAVLNEIHGVDYSIRYWRIVIGPWLCFFLQILYDRYLSIATAIDSGKVHNTWLPKSFQGDLVPSSFNCFDSWYRKDEYNLFLYTKIIKNLSGFNYETLEKPVKFDGNEAKKKPKWRFSLLNATEAISKIIPSYLNKVVFVASYLKPIDLSFLQLSLGQIPFFSIADESDISMELSSVGLPKRKKIKIQSGKGEFESLLPNLIKNQIPQIYVEGYESIVQKSYKQYPKNPKVIFTASALFRNDGFKIWASENIEKGAKFIVTQHGGSNGTSLWSSFENHEISVSDKYLTWGWENDNDKTVPLASPRLCWGKKIIKPNPKGNILWMSYGVARYSGFLYSAAHGPQYSDYIEDQKFFLKAVSPEVHKLLLLRLYPMDRGWCEEHMWKNFDPSLKIYRGIKSNFAQLKESRLSIGTYNGMGILETLSANYPTIIFWNPNHWELNESAKSIFEELLNVGIFHNTPESAAVKINEIYEDVQSWWMSDVTQRARQNFSNIFANTFKPLTRIKKEILKLE